MYLEMLCAVIKILEMGRLGAKTWLFQEKVRKRLWNIWMAISPNENMQKCSQKYILCTRILPYSLPNSMYLEILCAEIKFIEMCMSSIKIGLFQWKMVINFFLSFLISMTKNGVIDRGLIWMKTKNVFYRSTW